MILDTKEQKYNIRIENFEGPLDLLCHLIEINKYDINNLNISQICDQYIIYIKEQEKLNIEIASEFIVMASNLIYLKSKKLLPSKEEKEEITQEELVRRITEYRRYKQICGPLLEKYIKYSKRFSKPQEKLPKQIEHFEDVYCAQDIKNAYLDLYTRFENKKNENSKNIDKIVIKEKFKVGDKVKEIYKELYRAKQFDFVSKYSIEEKPKEEVVTAFSGLLELSRRQKVQTTQENLFGSIIVQKQKIKEDFS